MYALVAVAPLQWLDLVTTVYAMRQGALEANPVARVLIENGGIPAFALAKLAVVLAVWLIVLLMPPRGIGAAKLVLQFTNVTLAFVVLSNVGLMVPR